ncbi:MAG: hypothetical protein WC829_22315, partial [Hyphomicrobium sp.]
KAYDRKLAGEDVLPILDACRMAQMHQFVLDCGATFTDELYKLTRLSFSPFSNARTERKRIAEVNIKANCTRPPETESAQSPATSAIPAPAPAATTPAIPSQATRP